jgi:hypothetical protein
LKFWCGIAATARPYNLSGPTLSQHVFKHVLLVSRCILLLAATCAHFWCAQFRFVVLVRAHLMISICSSCSEISTRVCDKCDAALGCARCEARELLVDHRCEVQSKAMVLFHGPTVILLPPPLYLQQQLVPFQPAARLPQPPQSSSEQPRAGPTFEVCAHHVHFIDSSIHDAHVQDVTETGPRLRSTLSLEQISSLWTMESG